MDGFHWGLSAKINGDGPGAGTNPALANPASSSHPRISSKLYVPPAAVFTSMFTSNSNPSTLLFALGIDEELRNHDTASRRQRVESLLQQRLATLRTL